VKRLTARCGIGVHSGALTNLKSCAFQTKLAGPACRNHQFVGFVILQEDCKTGVSKCICYIADDLIQKHFKVEYGIDLRRHALKQKEFFDPQNLIEIAEALCGLK